MERYQRLPYFGTLRETEREEDREIAGEDRQSRKPYELRFLAADRQNWKGLIATYVPRRNDGLYYYYNYYY